MEVVMDFDAEPDGSLKISWDEGDEEIHLRPHQVTELLREILPSRKEEILALIADIEKHPKPLEVRRTS